MTYYADSGEYVFEFDTSGVNHSADHIHMFHRHLGSG